MPDAVLVDAHGAGTTLEEARHGRPAVVVFYRGAWCPFCNLTLRAYEQQLVPALSQRDVALIAISPQKPDGSLSMIEAHELTYTVLSDPGNAIAMRLGILTAPSEGARGAQAAMDLDIASGNADGNRRHADAHRGARRRGRDHPLDRRAPRLQHPHRARPGPRGAAVDPGVSARQEPGR